MIPGFVGSNISLFYSGSDPPPSEAYESFDECGGMKGIEYTVKVAGGLWSNIIILLVLLHKKLRNHTAYVITITQYTNMNVNSSAIILKEKINVDGNEWGNEMLIEFISITST